MAFSEEGSQDHSAVLQHHDSQTRAQRTDNCISEREAATAMIELVAVILAILLYSCHVGFDGFALPLPCLLTDVLTAIL